MTSSTDEALSGASIRVVAHRTGIAAATLAPDDLTRLIEASAADAPVQAAASSAAREHAGTLPSQITDAALATWHELDAALASGARTATSANPPHRARARGVLPIHPCTGA